MKNVAGVNAEKFILTILGRIKEMRLKFSKGSLTAL